MSELSILKLLVQGGMTPIAACAMGGNMYCESTMHSNIAQRGMTSLSDAEYTAAADAGTIDFVHDAVGYGLCQWTYYTRKQKLLEYARAYGVSVGDETMQVKFCLEELRTEYASLWSYLQTAQTLYSAAASICKGYEKPAVNNIQDRASAGNMMYMTYGSELDAMLETAADDNPLAAIDGSDGECEACTLNLETANKTASGLPEVSAASSSNAAEYAAAKYAAMLLESMGYNVLWLGLSACVKDFQQKNGLTVDGIIGEKTWAVLLN
jgi:murein L,D-transpeptidase YcbB/YkuD